MKTRNPRRQPRVSCATRHRGIGYLRGCRGCCCWLEYRTIVMPAILLALRWSQERVGRIHQLAEILLLRGRHQVERLHARGELRAPALVDLDLFRRLAMEGLARIGDDVDVARLEVVEVADVEMVIVARLAYLGLAERDEIALVKLKIRPPQGNRVVEREVVVNL